MAMARALRKVARSGSGNKSLLPFPHFLDSALPRTNSVLSPLETSQFAPLAGSNFSERYFFGLDAPRSANSPGDAISAQSDAKLFDMLHKDFLAHKLKICKQSHFDSKNLSLNHMRYRHFSSSPNGTNSNFKPNGRRTYLVDTLALVRKLEKHGLTQDQAEVITETITQILSESMDNISHAFVSKPDMQIMEISAESSLSKLKTEILSAHEHNVDSIQRTVERIVTDIEKLRSELRYEIDKVTAGQRLDLNLERGRIREELSNQNQQTINLTSKLDREINNLRTDLEAAKFDVIKYCVGTLVSVSAVALGLLRILM